MNAYSPADTLHRLVKQALDSGAAASLADAQAMFAGYRLGVRIAPENAGDPHHQAALLTTVALARRVFLGGVTVAAPTGVPMATPLPIGSSLAEAIGALGGAVGTAVAGMPLIDIGGGACPREHAFHIRLLFGGWRGGFVPAPHDASLAGDVVALAPMLAAGLAVNEAFSFVSGAGSVAGQRAVGLSLWRPDSATDWLDDEADEPPLSFLPSQLWLIGLGHLGQAYLWALGLLPYAQPADLQLVLQDVDEITPSTESTSILSDLTLVGEMKTRAMAAWCNRRGFKSVIHERLFAMPFVRQPTEPAVALCGLDNALGRQALDNAGFGLVVEAGLGRGHRDFNAIRLHTLPGSRKASQIWNKDGADNLVEDRPAYELMRTSGELDRCGVTLLAGKAVGAPFVGAVGATLAISEVLRLLHGGVVHELVDLDLKAPDYRSVVLTEADFSTFNPGFALAAEG